MCMLGFVAISTSPLRVGESSLSASHFGSSLLGLAAQCGDVSLVLGVVARHSGRSSDGGGRGSGRIGSTRVATLGDNFDLRFEIGAASLGVAPAQEGDIFVVHGRGGREGRGLCRCGRGGGGGRGRRESTLLRSGEIDLSVELREIDSAQINDAFKLRQLGLIWRNADVGGSISSARGRDLSTGCQCR